jgi:flavin reductase (DIM6/NTAB) family NADH-FMN oxidoreductase RutF
MYFETGRQDHGLPYNPFKACVVPRPIGWISSLSRDGVVNLAPFSQFQNLSYDPPFVMFAAGGRRGLGRQKDTVINVQATGEFVYNMATYSLRQQVARTSEPVPPEIDEFEYAGLEKAPSRLVRPPRVAASPIQFECRYYGTLDLPGTQNTAQHSIVIGQVLAVHINDECITADGRVDLLKIRPLARLGYVDYTSVTDIFQIEGAEVRQGMIGNVVTRTATE